MGIRVLVFKVYVYCGVAVVEEVVIVSSNFILVVEWGNKGRYV